MNFMGATTEPSVDFEYWDQFLLYVTSGVAAALTWAAIVLFYNVVRTWKLKRSLVITLQPAGLSMGITGFGIPIMNRSDADVVVRNVNLSFANAPFRKFEFAYEPGRPNERTGGGSLLHDSQIERGFVALPALCEGRWFIPKRTVALLSGSTVVGCEIIFEFDTFLGSRRIVATTSPPRQVADLNEGLNGYIRDILPGLGP